MEQGWQSLREWRLNPSGGGERTLTMLSQGARGIDVFVLQAQLNLAFPTSTRLVLDGIFGPLTHRRVLDFQRAQRLAVDGIVGPRTWDALSRMRGRSEPPPSFGFLCGNGNPANQQKSSAFAAALGISTPSRTVSSTAAIVSGGGLGLTPLVGSTFESNARAVYGNSLDYSRIFFTSQMGLQNRPFTVAVPMPPSFTRFMQVLNLGPKPSVDTLIHELGHAWQSQHHATPTAYMANCVACQAAALNANKKIEKLDPEVSKKRGFPENYPMSAYAYRPGAKFETYAGEQIAQQTEKAEAPIRAHVIGVAAGTNDTANTKSLGILNIKMEDLRDSAVKY